jgi:catechol 2,3-dioxygenase-like lactoylglutathione lyase family enzyme
MAATGMEHFTVLTGDLDRTVEFYQDLLGLDVGPRPPLTFAGAWLYCGGRAVLHVVAGRTLPEQRTGVIDHMAFAATDLATTVRRLKARGVDYDLRRQVGSGLWQMFFLDPNGAKVELDFPASESEPAAA